MRLSDLMNRTIVDSRGETVGQVNDVRLVQDGPYIEGFGAGLRVEGLVSDHGRLGERLGYHRGGVEGPLILKLVFRSLEKRGRYIPWDSVGEIDDELIHLTVPAKALRRFTED